MIKINKLKMASEDCCVEDEKTFFLEFSSESFEDAFFLMHFINEGIKKINDHDTMRA